MSIQKTQYKYFMDEVTRRLIQGGTPPAGGRVSSEVKYWMQNIVPGEPMFSPIYVDKRERSNIKRFNVNKLGMVTDLIVLFKDLLSQSIYLVQQLKVSSYIYDKLSNTIAKLYAEVDELLMLSENADGYLYSIRDTFRDDTYVNINLTTAVLDTKSRTVKLGEGNQSQEVDMSHYDGVGARTFIVDSIETPLKKYRLSTSRFDNIFKPNTDDWRIIVEMPRKTTVNTNFDIDLTEDKKDLVVNSFVIYSTSPKQTVIKVEYLGGSDTKWRNLPTDNNPRVLREGEEFVLKEPTLVRTIRVYLRKDVEDYKNGEAFTYDFGISYIGLAMRTHTMQGDLISKSLEFKDYNGVPLTIDKASVLVDDKKPSGTKLKYYVGLDEKVYGRFFNQNGHTVAPNDVNVYGFEEQDDNMGTEWFASQLRTYGVDDWLIWEPSWLRILPINYVDNITEDGEKPPRVIDFGTALLSTGDASLFTREGIEADYNVDGVSLFRIAKFPDDVTILDTSVKVSFGKNCVVREGELIENIEVEYANKLFDSVGEIEISRNVTDARGRVSAPGSVVRNSVVVRPVSTDEYVMEEGVHYLVLYTGGDAVITIQIQATRELLDINTIMTDQGFLETVKFKVQYEANVQKTTYVYTTYLYSEEGETITIATDSDGVTDRSSISDKLSVFLKSITPSGVEQLSKEQDTGVIELYEGWNQLVVRSIYDITIDSIDTNTKVFANLPYMVAVPFESLSMSISVYEHNVFALENTYDGKFVVINDPLLGNQNYKLCSVSDSSTVLTYDDIFATGMHTSDYYDIDYYYTPDPSTRCLLKVEMSSQNKNVTPFIRSYSIRFGYEIQE